MPKIAIYDRYLSTIGGGERYSCKAAEILSRQSGYQVHLLTDLHASLNQVSDRLGLDLSRVELKLFPFISPHYAQKITSGYDLFINTTYLSSLPAYGKSNLYICYFPTPFDVDFGPIHRFLLLFRKPATFLFNLAERSCSSFKDIEIISGLYEPQRFLLGRGSWSSGSSIIRFKGPIVLGLKNPASSPKQQMKVKVTAIKDGQSDEVDINLVRGQVKKIDLGTGPAEVRLKSDTFSGSGRDTRQLGVVAYDMSPKNFIKKMLLKLIGYIPQFVVSYPRNLDFLNTYQGIVAISRYSQNWIQKLWKRDSRLLFPPVEVDQFFPGTKQDIILSVGRFFPEHHNKKQLEMVGAFKRLHDRYPDQMKSYRLYLAGGLADRPEHQEYVQKIREEAEGYPVTIMANAGYNELLDLFSSARFFWHAAGMGESEEKHPEKFEHFGITTVEAMAAGCISIVINKGGQKEIIRDGVDGYLFDDMGQLEEITINAIRGQFDLESMARRARERATKFSSKNFEKELLNIVKDYIDHGS